MLLAIDLYEDFIDVEGVAVTLMLPPQSPGVDCSELVTPESDRFSGYSNASLGQQVFNISVAQIESEIEPDGIGNDIWRETMTLIRIHPTILSIWAR